MSRDAAEAVLAELRRVLGEPFDADTQHNLLGVFQSSPEVGAVVSAALPMLGAWRFDRVSWQHFSPAELVERLFLVGMNQAIRHRTHQLLPVTARGRHRLVDALLEELAAESPAGSRRRLLDVGTSFPPLTTVETAERFADWEIVGCDPVLPAFTVTAADGAQGLFDARGELTCILAAGDRPRPLPAHEQAARAAELKSVLAGGSSDGRRVERAPLSPFVRSNLRFSACALEDLGERDFDVVRACNVLGFFPGPAPEARRSLAERCSEGGLALVVSNLVTEGRLAAAVFTRRHGELRRTETVFSAEWLLPWAMTIQSFDEYRAMASLVGALRADDGFWPELEAELKRRVPPGAPPAEAETSGRALLLEEGFLEKAVSALSRLGHAARVRCGRLVAVRAEGDFVQSAA